MEFKSRKDTFFSSIIWITNLMLFGFLLSIISHGESYFETLFVSLLFIACIALLFWIFYGTQYRIENGQLNYVSGFLKGSIDIHRIREIIVGKTLWMGNRPATAKNGLIIKYDKYEEIYISPETNENFIEAILEIKKDILIREA